MSLHVLATFSTALQGHLTPGLHCPYLQVESQFKKYSAKQVTLWASFQWGTPSSDDDDDDAGRRLAPAQNSRNSETVRKQHCPGNPDRHLPLHPPLLMLPHLQPSLPPARGVETTSRHFVCAERVKEAGATEKKPLERRPLRLWAPPAPSSRIQTGSNTQPGWLAEETERD